MASMPSSARAGEVPCPDPSAHDHQHKLSEQASTAALYVTDPAHKRQQSIESRENPLGPDGKLSSKSAAASLKYAKAQDLPSFPSSGLGQANSAGKAALLASDYKMKDLWQPELSSAGSKAALLAHRDGVKLDLWEPSASKEGNSAAVLAMGKKNLSPELDRGYTKDGKHRALMAANLSVHRQGNAPPAPATPNAYPDQHNSAYNALNAATVSHRANSVKAAPDGWNSEANQAARITHIGKNVDPEMFGEHPPIEINPDDIKHQAALKASAVSMAKQMYQYQNRTVLGSDLTGKEGAEAAARNQQAGSGPVDMKQEALRYIHLQDAAHKLAQERLAKVDKNFEAAKYREYYGYPDDKPAQRKSMNRLSMRSSGRTGRGRAASEGQADQDSSDDDEQQARRIRNQMSQLNSGLSSVDEKKRTDDRARLMKAAEEKVHARMHTMDEKVFADTGKVSPAMMEEWEAKARKRAQEDKEMQAQHPGQTHIGGGKFIAQSEIEAIAVARLKPTLDEINETAEKKRARDEELRQEKAEQERQKAEEKQHKREEKDEQKRVKNEEKAARQREKDEAKARKSEDQRKSREVKREEATAGAGAASAEGAGEEEEPKRKSGLGRFFSRGKKDRNTAEDPVAAEAERTTASKPAVAALGGAGAAAGGLAVADAEDKDKPAETTEDREAREQAELDQEDDDESEPNYDPHPAVAVPTTAAAKDEPTGSQVTGAAPVQSSYAMRPELERHITEMGDEDSDDDFGDDEDDEEDLHPGYAKNEEELAERGREGFASHNAGVATAGAGAVGAIDPKHEGVSPLEEGRELQSGGPHTTITGNRLDPRVANDEPGVPTSEEEHHYGRDAALAGGAGAAGVGAYEATKDLGEDTAPATNVVGPGSGDAVTADEPSGKSVESAGDETGPAANTIGPHKSDIANIADPRVKPNDPEMLKAKEKHDEGQTVNDPEPTEKEQKGFRGLFSRLKKKDSREPGKISSSKYGDKDAAPAAAAGAGTGAAAASTGKKSTDKTSEGRSSFDPQGVLLPPHVYTHKHGHSTNDRPLAKLGSNEQHAGNTGTDGAIGGDPRAASPSSFKRGTAANKDLDDVSSSGAEEDDLYRGRSNEGQQGNGLTSKLGGKGKGRADDEDDDDQFEEARDHFDESLAPPPAFAGQAKNESPHRETKFREEV